MEDCRYLWEKSESFRNLQENMVLFLQGKCDENPWHGAPVDPETIPLLETLREINIKGFITVEGQPGTILDKKIGIETSFGSIGETYTEVQRAYMCGFILNNKADSFVQKLMTTRSVMVYKERLNAIQMYGLQGNMFVPNKNAISLTEEHLGNKVDYPTSFSLEVDTFGQNQLNMIQSNKKLYKILTDTCTFIFIAMKKQGDTNLDKLVLSCM
jgi:hypothetical protein